MPYCATADILARTPEETIVQLTDDQFLRVIDQSKVDQAIVDAGEIIDGYLRGRYMLPLQVVPGLIKKLAVDLALYNLYARKMDITFPQPVTDRNSAAMKVLAQIQSGMVSLGVETTQEPVGGNYRSNKTSGDRVFNKDILDEM